MWEIIVLLAVQQDCEVLNGAWFYMQPNKRISRSIKGTVFRFLIYFEIPIMNLDRCWHFDLTIIFFPVSSSIDF